MAGGRDNRVARLTELIKSIDEAVAGDRLNMFRNLGAIMRSCAHFGVKGVVVQDAGVLESGAAIRTARVARLTELIKSIDEAVAGDRLNMFRTAFRRTDRRQKKIAFWRWKTWVTRTTSGRSCAAARTSA
jgi:hypothetical protein